MPRPILLLVLLSASLCAQPSCQSELNGFLLGQSRNALVFLGTPSKTGDENGWKFQAYSVPERGYFIFEFAPDQPERIAAMQISGDVTSMRPFLGIKLGDSDQQLIAKFGKPSARKPEPELELTLLEYADRNYSFELDKTKHVSSIRILEEGCARQSLGKPLAPGGKPLLEELQAALESHDVDMLMQMLAADVEIYQSEKTYSFTRAARQELENGDTPLARLLFAPQRSVLAALKDEHATVDEQVRISAHHQPEHVIKFPDSKIVKEIVYDFQGGRWKVFEITFR